MEKKNSLNFVFLAFAPHGLGISGGDRIFIELARRWQKKCSVNIYTWEEGYEMCQRQHLEASSNLKFSLINMGIVCRMGFLFCYFARILRAILLALFLRLENNTIVYSASEFWMDSLPAAILKVRYPHIRWVAAWFQTAPNPWVGYSEGERAQKYNLSALLYWLMQLPVKPIISKFADFILVNNEEEKKHFLSKTNSGKTIVVLGAVDSEAINRFRRHYSKQYPKVYKKYDAVFQGRFHPQKGVVELIDIWRIVVNRKPNAKLALIGDGPLMNKVRERIIKLNLQKNCELFGYVFDGDKKYQIFLESKLVVHPAYYDSGGMAAAEAMGFGLPCVGFDLLSYKSYYPYGMIKVKIGDLDAFAKKIIELIKNETLREKIGREAKKMIKKNWSWDKRATEVLSYIKLG